jgi:hypothetical protein
MQLIEAALAFAITMLALSLVVSSFVEIIHRIFSMREAGLKYVLGQMFDQVLAKYVSPVIARVVADDKAIEAAARNAEVRRLLTEVRTSFVERMSANRAPMGVTPRTAVPGDPKPGSPLSWIRLGLSKIGLWNGRDLAAMTPAEFMERLGSIDVGQAIASANRTATAAAQAAGTTAADAVDVVLKDVAQKFEAFGKEASVYFEGRARLLSVAVALALAFLAHVDAVDLFRTYLRDPNARAKVIEQSGAVTAQYKAAKEAADALKQVAPDLNAAPPGVKEQVEKIRQDWTEAIGKVDATVQQYADLGVPLGWTPERVRRADMWQLVWTCRDPKTGESLGQASLRQACQANDPNYAGARHTQYVDVWFQIPMAPHVWFYLFLGGLLVGLGAPFWYNAVTGLTNIRNASRGASSTDPQTRAAAAAAVAGTTQPVTPVDAFRVSSAALP